MAEITDPTSRLVAARIRAIRTSQEITLTDLANRMRLDGPVLAPALLGRIENCNRAVSVPELAAIAAALDVTTDTLMRPGELCVTCGQEISR